MLTLKNLDFQLIFERNPSKATVSESGRQLHISKFLRLSLPTPDGFWYCYSKLMSRMSPPRSFVQTFTELSGFISYNTYIIWIIPDMSRKKLFFLFFWWLKFVVFVDTILEIFLNFFKPLLRKFFRSSLWYLKRVNTNLLIEFETDHLKKQLIDKVVCKVNEVL